MNIFATPDYLTNDTDSELLLLDYRTSNSNIKNKIVLKKNILSFLQEGSKSIIIDGKATTIDNDRFIVIKTGNCLMTENISEKDFYRSILFFFDDSALSSFCNSAKISRTKTQTHRAYVDFEYDEYIRQFVNSLIHIMQHNLQQDIGLLKTKFEEIMYYLLNRNGSKFIANLFSTDMGTSNDLRHIVETNKLNNLTLQELAFLCNMSVSSFKRHFVSCYQTSPIQWFLHKRLEYAAYLLKEEKRRPSDIYLEVGFQNLSSFTQAFKQRYNITPKQFQEEK